MEFSHSDVERAFEQVPLSDGFAREVLDGRILDALPERIFTPAGASADTPFPAYETERERRLITRSTLLTYAVIGDLQAGNFEVETPYPHRPIGPGFEQMVIRYGAVGLVESTRSGRPEFGVSVNLPPWFMDEFGVSERFYPQRASKGRSVGIRSIVLQPTIRRENTSVANAVNAIPDHVGTYVKSTTQSSFGRSARKSRCT